MTTGHICAFLFLLPGQLWSLHVPISVEVPMQSFPSSDSDFDEPYENRFKPDVQVVPAIKQDTSSREGGFAKIIRPW